MESIRRLLKGRDRRRMAAVGAAALTAFVGILSLAHLATRAPMALLFSGLGPEGAASVITELDARAVSYRVEGQAVYVPEDRRDQLRLELAAEGVQGDRGAGYEILDGLSGFGTTSQMFDAAYWRAKEGELARTILSAGGSSASEVVAARVHIAVPDGSPFSQRQKPSGSVTLRSRSGPVPNELARAVQALVAGAVPGLAAEAVTVVDGRTGRIVEGADAERTGQDPDARADRMRLAVEKLLAAKVGQGRFVAEVNVDLTRETERISERALDPAARVVVSKETEERRTSDRGTGGGGVSVASNLPDGDAGGETNTESQSEEARERVNYDHSVLTREIERGPGAIKRITVAVLVDGTVEEAEDGTTVWTPRDAVEIAALEDLVQSAVGYDEARGDVVTVRSMEFEAVSLGSTELASLPWLSAARAVELAAVTGILLLGLAAILAARSAIGRREAEPEGAPADGAATGLPAPDLGVPPALGAQTASSFEPIGQEMEASPPMLGVQAIAGEPDGVRDGGTQLDPVERLQQLITERREETVEVLRGWIEGTHETGPAAQDDRRGVVQ